MDREELFCYKTKPEKYPTYIKICSPRPSQSYVKKENKLEGYIVQIGHK